VCVRYCRLWKWMYENGVLASLECLHTDFEEALFSSLHCVIPCTHVYLHVGCFFHYAQAIYRNVRKKRLWAMYTTNLEFQICVKRLKCLALVPIELLHTCLDKVTVDLFQLPVAESDKTKILEFVDYFECTWIGKANHRPKFAPNVWNVFHHFQNRTNNRTESLHGVWNSANTIRDYADFTKLLKDKLAENTLTYMDILKGQIGQTNRSKKYCEARDRLLLAMQQLSAGHIHTMNQYLNICVGITEELDLDNNTNINMVEQAGVE